MNHLRISSTLWIFIPVLPLALINSTARAEETTLSCSGTKETREKNDNAPEKIAETRKSKFGFVLDIGNNWVKFLGFENKIPIKIRGDKIFADSIEQTSTYTTKMLAASIYTESLLAMQMTAVTTPGYTASVTYKGQCIVIK